MTYKQTVIAALVFQLFFYLFIFAVISCHAEEIGRASWYSYESCRREGTSGVYTASGERFREESLTAAKWNVPYGTRLRVTNLSNNKSVIVRVNDRGPARKLVRKGRVIDLSKGAFRKISALSRGTVRVKVEKL